MTAPTIAIPSQPSQPARTPSIAFPLVLIALGVAFLLGNLGYFAGVRWTDVLRLWPVLLVLAGVDVLLRPRSFWLAAVVEVAIVVAAFAYLVSGASAAPGTLSYSVDVPRAAATELDLTVNYGAGVFVLDGGGTDLVSVRSTREDVARTVDQRGASASVTVTGDADGAIVGPSDRRWEVTLPSDVRVGMTLNLGAGDFDVDLSSVRVTRATINSGASDLTVTLPTPKGEVPMTVATGASSVQIVVPAGVEYRVDVTGVLHSVSGAVRSAGYDTATDRVTITLSAAMSSVTIR